jgi:Methyltransferase domain
MGIFKLLINHNKKGSLVNTLRQKRFELLKGHIENLISQHVSFKILDIGGDLAYWKHIGWKHDQCKICLLNLYPIIIPQDDSTHFESIQGSALDMPVKKGEFDLFFSNSVIEHLGSYDNQQHFANEVKRLAEKYIIQTPSIWFPLEPHSLIPFFQFIPHPIRAYLIMCFNINYFPKAATYSEALMVSKTTLMLTKKQFQALFPEAEIRVERLFGIPKSYTAIKL